MHLSSTKKSRVLILLSVTLLSVPFFVSSVKAAQLTWTVETVDAALAVGRYSSIALDSNDRPHISYYDYYWDDLKYARWNGSEWIINPLHTVGIVGWDTSLALDSSDNAHISYHDVTNRDLRYAHVLYGGGWTTSLVDSVGIVGTASSIAIDSNENPHISYYDLTNQNLKYARYTGSIWSIETVDSSLDVGDFSSLALDSNDYPRIAYYDWLNYDLKYARWTGTSWAIETVDSDGNVGGYASLALDSNDNPHISYYDGYPNQNLKYAKYTGTSWTIETVDASKNVGHYTSIAIDSNDFPHISYYDEYWQDLKYAKMTDHGWLFRNVDNVGHVGMDTSIALDSTDHPHISYVDWTNDNLKYARDPDETIYSIYYDALDSDGNLQSDGVKINFDVDTTYSGTLPVFVHAHLTDSYGQLWATNSTLISITSDQSELTSLTLTIPSNAPLDLYSIYVVVEDDSLTLEDVFSWQDEITLYPPSTAQGGFLEGTVTDFETGDPVGFVEVQINGYTTFTNSSGQYFVELPAGVYNVDVQEEGYSSETIQGVTIVSGVTTTQDIVLQKSQYFLDLQVEGSGTLNPSIGIYSHLVGSEIAVQATPDSGWTFVYWLLDLTDVGSENPYSVTMDSNHVLKAVFIEESKIGFLQGTVTDFNSGSPIAEAEVVIGDAWFLTDSAGNYSLELEAGEYNVIVGAFDYQFQEALVTIAAGSTTVQDFALEKVPHTLVIEVVGSGTTNPNPGEHQIPSGTEVLVQAIPEEGWILNHWLLDSVNIGSENPISILMDSDHVLAAVFNEETSVEPLIESCTSEGSPKNVFDLGEALYLTGSFFSSSTTFQLYIVNDIETWINGMSIPSRIPDTEPAISSNADGHISPTIVWNNIQTEGKYDIIVDVNANGQYDAGVDALDDNDVEVTAGVQIIPEFSSTIILLILTSATLFALIIKKRLIHPRFSNK